MRLLENEEVSDVKEKKISERNGCKTIGQKCPKSRKVFDIAKEMQRQLAQKDRTFKKYLLKEYSLKHLNIFIKYTIKEMLLFHLEMKVIVTKKIILSL